MYEYKYIIHKESKKINRKHKYIEKTIYEFFINY